MSLQIFVSTLNSSATPLGAGQSFIGSADAVLDYAEIDVIISGSPAPAPATLFVEFSKDANVFDVSIPLIIPDPNTPPLTLRTILPFFRVRYINGVTPQSTFSLSTVLRVQSTTGLVRFISSSISPVEPVEMVRVVRSELPAGAATDQGLNEIVTALSGVLNVTGSVQVSGVTFPGSLTVTGSVGVANFPAIQRVTGSVGVDGITFPETINVAGSVAVLGTTKMWDPGTQSVSGSVILSNWPTVIGVSGSQLTGSTFAGSPVVVGGTYGSIVKSLQVDVSGAAYVTTSGSLPITGSVGIANFPIVQQVTGSVAVSGITFPSSLDVTVTGSTGLQVAASQAQPLWVTGSITQGTGGVSAWLITGSVGSFDAATIATEATLSKRFGVALGTPSGLVTAAGPTTLYTPSGTIRLKWLHVASSQNNTLETIVSIKLGSNLIYEFPVGAPGVFSHSSVREASNPGDLLTISLSPSGQSVYVNYDLEEF